MRYSLKSYAINALFWSFLEHGGEYEIHFCCPCPHKTKSEIIYRNLVLNLIFKSGWKQSRQLISGRAALNIRESLQQFSKYLWLGFDKYYNLLKNLFMSHGEWAISTWIRSSPVFKKARAFMLSVFVVFHRRKRKRWAIHFLMLPIQCLVNSISLFLRSQNTILLWRRKTSWNGSWTAKKRTVLLLRKFL